MNPATQEDVRSLKRWLVVLAIWSMLTTGVAAVAFSESRDADADNEHSAAQIRRELAAVRDLHAKRLTSIELWIRRHQRKGD